MTLWQFLLEESVVSANNLAAYNHRAVLFMTTNGIVFIIFPTKVLLLRLHVAAGIHYWLFVLSAGMSICK